MTAGVVANSCRLTIISSTLRVDLAVPMHIAVAELLTIVVSRNTFEHMENGQQSRSWTNWSSTSVDRSSLHRPYSNTLSSRLPKIPRRLWNASHLP